MIRNGTSDVVSHIARLLESGDGSAIPLPGLPGWEFVQSKPHTKLDQLGPESNILAKCVGAGRVWGMCGVCVAGLCRSKRDQLGPESNILAKWVSAGRLWGVCVTLDPAFLDTTS